MVKMYSLVYKIINKYFHWVIQYGRKGKLTTTKSNLFNSVFEDMGYGTVSPFHFTQLHRLHKNNL